MAGSGTQRIEATGRRVSVAPEVDRRVGDLAATQHGVVARRQLLALGLSGDAVDVRARRGWLRPVHRGVYAVGREDLVDRGRWMAAVLASGARVWLPASTRTVEQRQPAFSGSASWTGDDAPGPVVLLSHHSAAALHGLLPARDRRAVEITTASSRKPRPGIRSHRSRQVDGAATVRDGIPCTTVARTLVDVAASGNAAAFERAWSSAASRRLLRRAEVERELSSSPSRAGAAAVREAFAADTDYLAQPTRSRLERDALRLCRDFGLPRPYANRLLRLDDRTVEADLLWPDARLVVEIDGDATHEHASARRNDRERDLVLDRAGWRTLRIAESELLLDRVGTAERLRQALAPRAPPL
ncbi:MAG: type IV toxin-antitoxin system AbiEi family antitoxin domain-containing protein [Patulibacter sp.]